MKDKSLILSLVGFNLVLAFCVGVVGLMQFKTLGKLDKTPGDVYAYLEYLTEEKAKQVYRENVQKWAEELAKQNPELKVPPMPDD